MSDPPIPFQAQTAVLDRYIHKVITYNLTSEGSLSRGKDDRIVVL